VVSMREHQSTRRYTAVVEYFSDTQEGTFAIRPLCLENLHPAGRGCVRHDHRLPLPHVIRRRIGERDGWPMPNRTRNRFERAIERRESALLQHPFDHFERDEVALFEWPGGE